jgi:hypothetical protein
MSSDNPRLFVSYSREDAAFAERLATDLRTRGLNVWFDRLDIPTGAPWDIEVEAGLRASQGALVVLSPTSVASQNVMDEVSFALSEGKRILPVLHRPCAIPLRLARLQYVDFTRSYDDGLRRLIQDLLPARAAASASSLPAETMPREESPPPSPAAGTAAPPVAHTPGEPTGGARWPVGRIAVGVGVLLACLVVVAVMFTTSETAATDDAAATPPMESTATTAPTVSPGSPHPDHPHVVADASGQWVPENGYEWVDTSSAAAGGPVAWKPGTVHEAHPHVVAAESEGDWTPAPGYTWVDVDAPDLLVVWKPGKAHGAHPNVVAGDKEGTWRPADGYDWVNPDDQADLRVQRAATTS